MRIPAVYKVNIVTCKAPTVGIITVNSHTVTSSLHSPPTLLTFKSNAFLIRADENLVTKYFWNLCFHCLYFTEPQNLKEYWKMMKITFTNRGKYKSTVFHSKIWSFFPCLVHHQCKSYLIIPRNIFLTSRMQLFVSNKDTIVWRSYWFCIPNRMWKFRLESFWQNWLNSLLIKLTVNCRHVVTLSWEWREVGGVESSHLGTTIFPIIFSQSELNNSIQNSDSAFSFPRKNWKLTLLLIQTPPEPGPVPT